MGSDENNIHVCLNSTMVRLKLEEKLVYSHFYHESQFHYGSIKTIYLITHLFITAKSLNSTMVRLKLVKVDEQNQSVPVQSQFHYGSIKTQEKTIKNFVNESWVSIPLWFD